jgi:hypothetical protein
MGALSKRWAEYKSRTLSTRLLVVPICLCLVVSVCFSLATFYSYDFQSPFSVEETEEELALNHVWTNFTITDPEGLEHMESNPYLHVLLF